MITQKSILVKVDVDLFSEMEADIARNNRGYRSIKRNRYINDAIRHYINVRRKKYILPRRK